VKTINIYSLNQIKHHLIRLKCFEKDIKSIYLIMYRSIYTVIRIVILLELIMVVVVGGNDFQILHEMHTNQHRTFLSFIKTNVCRHLYIDMGTNVGMQFRKLYEPHYFPGARSLPYFSSTFGDHDRRDVCAIGFEPNSLHTERLVEMQRSYQKANFPLVIFTNTAVSTYNGKVVFYRAPYQQRLYHESGASTVAWSGVEASANETAIAVDIDLFLHHVFHFWKQSSAYNQSSSLAVAKLDIEGGEYKVLPHMLAHGSLCKIDQMLIEWHERFFPNATEDVLFAEKSLVLTTKNANRCRFKKVDIDDNDYADGTDKRPFPSPANVSLLHSWV
jgi:hypothetical protein